MNTQNNQYLDDYVEKYRDIKEKWLKDFNKSHECHVLYRT